MAEKQQYLLLQYYSIIKLFIVIHLYSMLIYCCEYANSRSFNKIKLLEEPNTVCKESTSSVQQLRASGLIRLVKSVLNLPQVKFFQVGIKLQRIAINVHQEIVWRVEMTFGQVQDAGYSLQHDVLCTLALVDKKKKQNLTL